MWKKVETFLAWSEGCGKIKPELLGWHWLFLLPRAAACLWPGREEGLGGNLGLSSEMTGQALKEVNPSSKEERRRQNCFFLNQPNAVTT